MGIESCIPSSAAAAFRLSLDVANAGRFRGGDLCSIYFLYAVYFLARSLELVGTACVHSTRAFLRVAPYSCPGNLMVGAASQNVPFYEYRFCLFGSITIRWQG